MSTWETYQKLLKMQKEGYKPYRNEVFIVDSPIADEKLETTVMHFRNLIDNYSRVFCCLLAKFYETLLIQIYEHIDIDIMELARTRFSERFDLKSADGESALYSDTDFELQIENGLQSVIMGDGAFDYLYESVGAFANLEPRLLESFAKDMASIELEFLYSGIELYERNDMQEIVVKKYGEPMETDYLAHGFKLGDYNLKAVIHFLEEMDDPMPMVE